MLGGKQSDVKAGERKKSRRKQSKENSNIKLSEGNGFIYLIQCSHLLPDLIQLSTYSRAVEIATSDHLSSFMVCFCLWLTAGVLRKTKWLDREPGATRECIEVKMLQYMSPRYWPRACYFFTPVVLQLFFMAWQCGSFLLGELTHLLDVSWEGGLLSSVVPSPANCCAVLRDLELHIWFLLCMHKSWELYPIYVAAGLRDENLVCLRHVNEPHWCKIDIAQVRNVICWDFPLKYSPSPLLWQQSH